MVIQAFENISEAKLVIFEFKQRNQYKLLDLKEPQPGGLIDVIFTIVFPITSLPAVLNDLTSYDFGSTSF